MLVTMDVVATRRMRDARHLLRDIEDLARPDGVVIGSGVTGRGDRLHAPWPPNPRTPLIAGIRRRDGWGTVLDMRRAFVVAAWDDEEALERFGAESPWPDDAEHWHVRLRPLRVTGSVGGSNPLHTVEGTAGTDDSPGAVITYALVPRRYLREFIPILRGAADGSHEGALCSFGAVSGDWRHFKGFTISCWSRLGDAVSYAYRDSEGHRRAMEWYEKRKELGEAWFARFELVRSEGTLAGRDPFAAVTVAPCRGPSIASRSS